jgi:hypothetical protein
MAASESELRAALEQRFKGDGPAPASPRPSSKMVLRPEPIFVPVRNPCARSMTAQRGSFRALVAQHGLFARLVARPL